MDQVAGRLPVIVGVSHPSAKVAVERSRAAGRAGAVGVLSLPPFYGQWTSDAAGVFRYFAELDDAAGIAVVVQDHPLSGVPLPPPLLARMANELERARYFKIEVPRSPNKMAELMHLADGRVSGIFGGMGGITFLEELERGASGTMPSSAFPDVFAAIWRAHTGGDALAAREIFHRYLPLIRFELHLAGKDFQKELLKLGGIISSSFTRSAVPPSWDETTRLQMIELVQHFDLLALRSPLPPFEKN
jgi:4-hydroxy-tetrahydrodipicolinate synthase